MNDFISQAELAPSLKPGGKPVSKPLPGYFHLPGSSDCPRAVDQLGDAVLADESGGTDRSASAVENKKELVGLGDVVHSLTSR